MLVGLYFKESCSGCAFLRKLQLFLRKKSQIAGKNRAFCSDFLENVCICCAQCVNLHTFYKLNKKLEAANACDRSE